MAGSTPWGKASPETGTRAAAPAPASYARPRPGEGAWLPREDGAEGPDALAGEWAGRRGPLFRLALVTGVKTVLTLGVYRFWMKTRLRRWYWSAIRPGGWPLEYVGDPWEKLLGFLIAVVILAFYIGVVNLLLMFASFSLFQDNFAAYLLSFLGVIPLWFFATYRARRYVLARTRWRGLRFGLEPGAWGYTWRAMVHWAITLCSAGLLWPRMTFWLEKYVTDRTFLGTQRLHQGGRWWMLLRAAGPAYLGAALLAGLAAWVLWLDPLTPEVLDDPYDLMTAPAPNRPERLWLLVPLGLWFLYALVHYRVRSRALLACAKTAGGLALEARPRPLRIGFIYVVGHLLLVLALMVPLSVLGVAGVMLEMAEAGYVGAGAGILLGLPQWLLILGGVLIYFTVFVMWSTLRHVLVTLPVWRHYAATLTVTGAGALEGIGQRARDEFEEAEGFAEALDVGAAI